MGFPGSRLLISLITLKHSASSVQAESITCSIVHRYIIHRRKMSSEPTKPWNQIRLLHTATEGLRKDGDASSTRKGERRKEREKEASSASSEAGEEQTEGDESHDGSSSPLQVSDTTKGEGVGKERLAELRSHLQAQFSIQEQQEDPSPGTQLMDLVGRIVHREGNSGGSPGSTYVGSEGQCPACGQCSNPSACSNGLPTEVGKVLQREIAVLKGEVRASIESMRREVVEELSSLRETLQAYHDPHFPQASDLSPLEELDENVLDQQKGNHCRLSQGGKPGDKISLEEKFKSWSVPTLHPLPITSRTQAKLRAVTTMTAKDGFFASLSRSNSDPVEPMQAKSITLPPAVPSKVATKKHPVKPMPPPAPRTYAMNGKYSGKMASRTMEAHPPCGGSEGKPH